MVMVHTWLLLLKKFQLANARYSTKFPSQKIFAQANKFLQTLVLIAPKSSEGVRLPKTYPSGD